MKRVAITGGSGFVGQAIYKKLLERDHEVVLLDRSEPPSELPRGVRWRRCDVVDRGLVKTAMEEEKPDFLFHLAGMLGTTELTFMPAEAAAVNVLGTANLMQIVADGGELPPTFFVSKPSAWPNLYTTTKDAAREMVEFYMDQRGKGPTAGVDGVIHKWFNAYGPGQHTHPIRKAVPYMSLMALDGRPIRIHGDGTQTADYIHIDDIADIAVTAMLDRKRTGKVEIDVGTGFPVDINYLAKTIIELAESDSKIQHLGIRTGEIAGTELVANPVRLNRVMGEHTPGYHYPFRDFRKALGETVDYYRKLPAEQRKAALDFYEKTDLESTGGSERALMNWFREHKTDTTIQVMSPV